jgi:hypothetical protein
VWRWTPVARERARQVFISEMRHAGLNAVHPSVSAVDRIWMAAGAGAVYKGHTIEQCFRDIHTQSQHIYTVLPNLEPIGTLYFNHEIPTPAEKDDGMVADNLAPAPTPNG